MSKIGIIIEREYLERVKKKSFIFTTILMPLLMLGLMALPALIMAYVDGSETTIVVVDNSGKISQHLTDTPEVKFVTIEGITVDSALTANGSDGVLVIPENIVTSSKGSLKLLSNGPSSFTTESIITSQVNKIIETERLKLYNIADLDRILKEVSANVGISTVRLRQRER